MRYLVEALGTYFLVLSVVFTGNPLIVGATLAVVIYAGYSISGAHYNPAVTLVIWWKQKMKVQEVAGYLGAQLVAGFLAALTVSLFNRELFLPVPNGDIFLGKSLLIEFSLTFVLVFVILLVASSKKTTGNKYYGLAIGATVYVISLVGGGISGGAYNPAVATGPLLVDLLSGGTSINHLWLYFAGPVSGGLLAGFVFWLVSPEDFS